MKWAKPCFPIGEHGLAHFIVYTFFVTMAVFFLTNGARPNSPALTYHWGPGIDGENQVSHNRWVTRFVGEAREEGARRPSIKGEAEDE